MNKDNLIYLGVGMLIGGITISRINQKATQKEVNRLLDEMNIRTDLINWIATVGVYLQADEFWEQYKERAIFINLVSE